MVVALEPRDGHADSTLHGNTISSRVVAAVESRSDPVGSTVVDNDVYRIASVRVPGQLVKLEGTVDKHRAIVMVDSGSTGDFISEKLVQSCKLYSGKYESAKTVWLADGKEHIIQSYIDSTIKLGDLIERIELAVIPLVGYDVILGIPWLKRHNPVIDWNTSTVLVKVGDQMSKLPGYKESNAPAVELVSRLQAVRDVEKGEQMYLALVRPLQGHSDDKQLVSHSNTTSLVREFSEVFPHDLPKGLPPKRAVDHKIELESGQVPPSRPTYRMSQPEMDELKKKLAELMEKGFITESKSPYGAPVLFLKKKGWYTSYVYRLSCIEQDHN
jgi:gag-polyprotein putative aspartyl protease